MNSHFSTYCVPLRGIVFGIVSTICLSWSTNVQAQSADLELANRTYDIFRSRCYQCHGAELKAPGLLVLERDSLVKSRGEDLYPFITPGILDESELWSRVDDGSMPPEKVLPEGLPDEEVAIIRQWIEAGAPQWETGREIVFIPEADILQKISLHLFTEVRDPEAQRFQRYFSIAHLHNNESVSDLDLRLYRAALAKAINSMSRRPGIVVPEAIDEQETIFNVDLRALGWEDIDLWDDVVKEYPYGLKPQDPDARKHYDQIASIYGEVFFDGIPYLRADWFIVKATRPPLYHKLTDIPDTLKELQDRLGVNASSNFAIGTSLRAGVFESGVSAQNRLVEYHPSNIGAFWLSYDFKKDSGRSNLARFPLGPKFEGNQFSQFAFEHDGGEIIFELPNGLHGYMLIDNEGNRIDAGPVEIVFDATNTSGSPLIVNGISCMNCHKYGTIDLADDIREGHALFNNDARNKVLQLYPQRSEMDRIVEEVRSDYLSSLRRAIGSFLLVGEDAGKKVTDFPEPVSHVARLYDKNLGLEEAARELGFEDTAELGNHLRGKRLQQLGLGPLVNREAGTIKRSYWESVESGISIFQEAASEIGTGSPVQ
ncbi:Planctomycete cytochrome C [Maioricimonas rarisocia]|uniref:Planctomycete cytochrome C n=1 Tax=Maioricimonas rarisocia TaxID=2528026 RepID=A0A517ZEG3_9PLAN|nr:c-type cytochrome domain-containing protein [Maioricimonas rarisocia]QDU40819.1 Planctomycete cytochrome C [Maioricimonas rarisocia]